MQIDVSGQNIEITQALRAYAAFATSAARGAVRDLGKLDS